jgi:acyl carrier protein
MPSHMMAATSQLSSDEAASTISVRSTVIAKIEQIAAQHKRRLRPLTDDADLMTLGLDSLCLAILVTRLEDDLGVDPFSASGDLSFPVTLGDLVDLYEKAAR